MTIPRGGLRPFPIRSFRLAAILAAFASWRCMDVPLAGGSTEVGNSEAVAGTVRTLDGTPAASARVSLIPRAFDACGDKPLPASRTVSSDAFGAFRIRGADPGGYNVQAYDARGATTVLLPGVVLPPDGAGGNEGLQARLAENASLSIPLALVGREGYAYLPGTLVCARIDSQALSAQELVLRGVPAGVYPELIRVAPGSAPSNILAESVTVAPGSLSRIGPYAAWSKRRKAIFDLAGAVPKSDLLHFPLPVRLDASNFDFTSAKGAGEDLRVTKADGVTPLPFEIARWNAADRTAEIWIALDTIRAGAASSSFYLYSGNPSAAPASGGAAVFDTGAGFSGVWHLGDGLEDATANGNHGRDQGTLPAAGAIGAARRFDGSGAHVAIADAPSLRFGTGDFTLSAWVAAESFGPVRQVFCKRDSVSNYEVQFAGDGRPTAMLDPKGDKNRYLFGPAAPAANVWIQLAFVRSGGRAWLYQDGAAVAGPLELGDSAGPETELWIGADPFFSGAEGFLGLIDEVVFSKVARSPEWLQLSASSQQPGSRRVILGPLE
jgi:hypothetical protein